MIGFLGFILFLSIIYFIIALIFPRALFWSKNPDRIKAIKHWLIIAVPLIILMFIFSPSEEKGKTETENNKTQVTEKEQAVEALFKEGSIDNINAAQKTLINYLEAIKKQQWAQAIKYTQLTWRKDKEEDELARELENKYYSVIDSYKIEEARNKTDVMKSFTVTIKLKGDKNNFIIQGANVICETAPYKPDANGSWGVNPISATIIMK